jgi:adenine-specific DNA-methyltransferase
MNFNQPYNRQQYLCFFRDELLPEDFETCDEKIEVDFQSKFIKHINKIGESPSLEVNVYEITHKSENDPRISLSRESFRLLSQYGTKRALVLFVPENQTINYRLSLITIDLKWEEGTQVKKEYSNPHRYSFFLGPGAKTHTPKYYLVQKGRVRDFDDLKNRFSIEVVNKDFYIEIACLFTELAGGERTVGRKKIKEDGCLSLPYTSDENLKKEFAVRLIGRLIFCWFLKKKNSNSGKPLIPEELLSTQSVKQNQNFYHNILEPLFFGTLNTPIEDRNELYKTTPWDQIPFLNGGLFEPGIHDYYDIDQVLGISKNINTLKVPDSWLTELFKIFETYNFTIDENTSVDIELSIEPEMLGRIFENLLAEINPETGETARKSTGSYYTPRPIVDFMVNESLKQYMLTKTEFEEDKISSLLAYEEEKVELSDDEQEVIIDALDNIKIIDPACGSGAFPMGILQKMLLILQKIDPESKKWANKKIARIDNYLLKNEFMKKVEEGNWDYLHKLGIIQNSIYGVDIQSIAVDISRLRFFLSLIVDENVDDSQENRGIKPLPNLEFKFVCANSLIGLPDVFSKKSNNHSHPKIFEKASNIEKLRELREKYFGAYGDDKKRIEGKFQELQNKMFLSSLTWIQWGGAESQTVKLSQWNPFSGEPCDWFDPDWMFGVKDGFDVVIANPPYIKEYTNRNAFDGLRKSPYYQGKMDLWYFFACIGLDFLKTNGIECFIATNNWVTNAGASKFRNKVIEESKIIQYIDFGNYKVFETAGVQTMVFFLQKDQQEDQYMVKYSKLLDDKISVDFLEAFLNDKKNSDSFLRYNVDFNRLIFKDSSIYFLEPEISNILNKLKSKNVVYLKDSEVANGIHPHHSSVTRKMIKKLGECHKVGDGIFLLTEEEKINLNLSESEQELLKPVYTSKELGKYYSKIRENKYWIIYTDSKFKNSKLINNFPSIKNHLDKFCSVITSDNKPYGLHRSRKEKFFKGEKIMSLRKCSIPVFTYTDHDCYVLAEYYVIKTDKINLKYLVALLNSRLIEFWLFYHGKIQGNNYQIDKEPILEIPIKQVTKEQQNSFINIVDNIISIVKSEEQNLVGYKKAKINEYERQINQMVYQLYGLTDEEIEIVENFNKK